MACRGRGRPWRSDAAGGTAGLHRPRRGRIHASYRVVGDACELTAIHAEAPARGIGSTLLERVVEAARAAGCTRVWLTTTNDNLDALRFYQRRGFRLVTLRPGAVDEARRLLKPEIPETGSYGSPMRDELDLVLDLDA